MTMGPNMRRPPAPFSAPVHQPQHTERDERMPLRDEAWWERRVQRADERAARRLHLLTFVGAGSDALAGGARGAIALIRPTERLDW